MNLSVTGVETIEVRDPQGLCDELDVDAIKSKTDNLPSVSDPLDALRRTIPAPINPMVRDPKPWKDHPLAPTIYTHQVDPKHKWQRSFTGDPQDAVLQTTAGGNWARGMRAATTPLTPEARVAVDKEQHIA